MRLRPLARGLTVAGAGLLALATLGLAAASGETNLQETTPLLWALIAISFAGAILVFAIMIYALVKFRDPATRRRRYG